MTISVAVGDQRRSLSGCGSGRPIFGPGVLDRWFGIAEAEAGIVEVLAQQDNVGQRVVYGQNEHCRQDMLKHGTEDVEDVAEQPDDDEFDTQPFRRASAEVLNDLGTEDDDPTGDGYGAAYSRNGFNVDAVAAGWWEEHAACFERRTRYLVRIVRIVCIVCIDCIDCKVLSVLSVLSVLVVLSVLPVFVCLQQASVR